MSTQIPLPFNPPVFPKRRPKPAVIRLIPCAASWRICQDVFAEYSAYLEADLVDQAVSGFIADVETQFRRLFGSDAERIQERLIENPLALPASRQALGEVFLREGLWPVKAYFGRG